MEEEEEEVEEEEEGSDGGGDGDADVVEEIMEVEAADAGKSPDSLRIPVFFRERVIFL